MKKTIYKLCVIVITIIMAMLSSKMSAAETAELTKRQQVEVIKALRDAFAEHYIYLDKANKVNLLLEQLTTSGSLENRVNKGDFSKSLTSQIQNVIADKHFRVIVPRNRPARNASNHVFDNHLNALTQFRTGGFKDIKMLEGNVGYVKIDGFRGEERHQVDGLMTYLRTADAIIIDLSDNGGGGRPVNYLSSYFLPEGTLIGKTYHRTKDTWRELRAKPVLGEHRLDVPLFIITSDFTFSAAEAFAYNLQARGRATIVGQVSKGGAHPTAFFPLNNGMAVLMPNRRSYNPITKANWELTGVIPEHITDKANALAKSHELAKEAAVHYRSELFETLKSQLQAQSYSKQLQSDVTATVKAILHRKHVEPFMIAGFANALARDGHKVGAKLLYKANVLIHQQSADAHFSYAEYAFHNDEFEVAKSHINTAIQLADNEGRGIANPQYESLRQKIVQR